MCDIGPINHRAPTSVNVLALVPENLDRTTQPQFPLSSHLSEHYYAYTSCPLIFSAI